MNKTKEIWQNGLALFALFFGAGNLILPPYLGVLSGSNWYWVVMGFVITAVIVPVLGILAHAKIQGTLFDIAKPVSPLFSYLFCICIYVIAVTLPAPRTAAVTHEMAIAPFFNISSWITSSVYFGLTFVFVINRTTILSFVGRFLTPIIVLILLAIIGIATLTTFKTEISTLQNPFVTGFLEGYQTFDAIGGIVVGAVIIVSLNINGYTSYTEKRKLITQSGIIAGFGLLMIYGGLIFSGAKTHSLYHETASRTDILNQLSVFTLGNVGNTILSVLVALACFTTGVGIITGASDYVRSLFQNSKKAYVITAFIGCLLGVLIGQMDVHYIITVAVPALLIIYPITIVLIILNVVPSKWAKPIVFKTVVGITFLFSIPDFINHLGSNETLQPLLKWIPFSEQNLGWVLPALVALIATNLGTKKPSAKS